MSTANLQPLKVSQIFDKAFHLFPKFFTKRFFLIVLLFSAAQLVPIANIVTGLIFNIMLLQVANKLWLNPEKDLDLDSAKLSGKIGQYLLLGMRIMFFTFLWSLLLVVPGIIYLLNRSFAQYPLLLDGKSITESLEISKKLMTYPQSKIRLFCIYLLYFILIVPIFMILGAGAAVLFGNNILLSFLIGFFQLFASAYFILPITGLYWDIRTRSEGLDLQNQIDNISAQ